MPETERRRKRAAVSCVLCRRRKIRCNRELPCSNCLRARNGVCVYEPFPGSGATAASAPAPATRKSLSGSPPLAESPPRPSQTSLSTTQRPHQPPPTTASSSLGISSTSPPVTSTIGGVTTTLPAGPFFGEVIPSGGRVPCPRDVPMFGSMESPPILPRVHTEPSSASSCTTASRSAGAGASPDGNSGSTAPRDGDGDIASLKTRVQQLEAQLAQLTTGAPPASSAGSVARTATSSGSDVQSTTATSNVVGETHYGTNTRIQTATSSFGGTFHIHRENHCMGHDSDGATFSVSHKTRLFGQSHWVNSVMNLYMDAMLQMEPYVRDPGSRGYVFIQRCKHVSRLIKAQRCPQWPAPLTPDLPPKDLADKLVNCYLKTTERVYRILHVPSFMKSYERIWQPGVTPKPGFLVQVKLVLALGSIAYDDMFTMRTQATHWLYEAMTWLADPDFKRRLHLELLQSKIMVLIAREAIGIGGHMVWNAVGDVQRLAIIMGLHRDPIHLPRMSVLAREMRRRLWNTILELCLSTSLASGGPPMFSVEDFDTAPPGNFNDDELLLDDDNDGRDVPTATPDAIFTDSSVAIALRRSIPVRLAITRFLNDLSGPLRTYQEAVRLDAEFRDCYKIVRRHLLGGTGSPSAFAQRFVDMQMHRALMALHARFSGPEAQPAMHAYSRKVVLEAALTLWTSANSKFTLTPHALAVQTETTNGSKDDHSADDRSDSDDKTKDDTDYMDRIMAVGAGIVRSSLTQAACVVATELRLELREDEEAMGMSPIRLDLLAVLQDAKRWSLRCIETGEKNVKGYIGMSLIDRQIRALIQKTPKEEIPALLVKQLEEDEQVCLQMLENHLAMLQATQPGSNGQPDGLQFSPLQTDFSGAVPGMVMGGGGVQESVDLGDSQMADWQSMVGLDVFSGTERLDQVSWIFDDMASQGMPW